MSDRAMFEEAAFEERFAAMLRADSLTGVRPFDRDAIARTTVGAGMGVRDILGRIPHPALVLAVLVLVGGLVGAALVGTGRIPTIPGSEPASDTRAWAPSPALVGETIAPGVRLVPYQAQGRPVVGGMDDVVFTPDGGVWFMRPGTLTRYGHTDAFPPPSADRAANDLATSPDGTIWALLGGAVLSFHDGAWASTPSLHGPATAIAVTPDGAVWAVSRSELALLDGDGWTRWAIGDGASERAEVRGLLASPDGSVWILPKTGGDLLRFRDGTLEEVPWPFDGFHVVLAAIGPQGELWIWATTDKAFCHDSTQARLVRFLAGDWLTVPDSPVIASDCYHGGMTAGHDGRLWVTAGDRIVVYDGTAWTNVLGPVARSDDPEMTISTQAALTVAPDGSIWLAGHSEFIVIDADAGR